MQYTKQMCEDLKNVVNLDNISISDLTGMIKLQFKKCKTVCSQKRASKYNKRYYYIGSGFDTETTTDIKNNVAFVYIWQFTIGEKTYISRHLFKLPIFTRILSSSLKKAKLLVYGANISYDFQFIKHTLAKQITFAFASEARKILSYELNDKIIVMDVLGVWGSSLTKCTEYTTRKKLIGDLDYLKYRTPLTPLSRKELMYCIHDTLICSELCIKAFEMYTKQGKKIPITGTAIVRNELKDSYSKIEKKIAIEELQSYYEHQKNYNILRQYLYSGGLTHSNCNYVGIVMKNVICYDIESSYPSQMLKNFPAGQLIHCYEDWELMKKHKHWFMRVRLLNVSAKSDHTLVSKHKIIQGYDNETKKPIILAENAVYDNGRLFACTSCEIIINEIDFENLKKFYKFSMEIVDCWYFTKSAKIPKKLYNMVVKYYKLKTVLKREGKSKTLEYKEAKARLNSLYGMLCTQIYSRELSYNSETGTFEKIEKDWKKCNRTFMNCFIGYWVASYARQQLCDIISKFPENVIQYDTDSIYAIDPNGKIKEYVENFNENKRKFNLMRTNDEDLCNLGIWDYDGKYTEFCGYGAKRYAGIKEESNTLKITWAGGVSSDIKQQFRVDKKLGHISKDTNIFEYLKNFECFEITSKKYAKYIDEPTTIQIDSKPTIIKSCVVICPATFKTQLSIELEELKHKTTDLRDEYIKKFLFENKGVNINEF